MNAFQILVSMEGNVLILLVDTGNYKPYEPLLHLIHFQQTLV